MCFDMVLSVRFAESDRPIRVSFSFEVRRDALHWHSLEYSSAKWH